MVCFLLPSVPARKKVAVVLCGGGAKGTAHIGALKVIEEAGIPIDMIVGTSMGAIVGGLYAIGYTPHQLDSAVNKQDWMALLSDKIMLEQQPFNQRDISRLYQLSFPFTLGKDKHIGGGVINGRNIENLFSEMTVGYHKEMDFNDLPVAFACVATNVVDGKAVVFHQGKIDVAMRASMAIPAVFTPVRMDSMVLVDGGLVNNFPVNVAKQMGADYVIGIDLESPLRTAGQLTGTKEILGQIVGLVGEKQYQENKKQVTVYIHPDTENFTAASFSIPAIDTLIVNGERATREKWGELMKLKRTLGLDTTYMPPRHGPYIIQQEVGKAKVPWYQQEVTSYENTLNFGLRFDTEEIGALLVNGTLHFHWIKDSRLSLTGRLSKNPFVHANYAWLFSPSRSMNVGLKFSYNDIDIYKRGKRQYNTTFRYYRANWGYEDVFKKRLKVGVELRYEFFDYDSFLYDDAAGRKVDVKPHGFLSYYAHMAIETFDQWYFPTKGVYMKVDGTLFTDNMVTYKGHAPFAAIGVSLNTVAQISKRFALLPSVFGRVLIGNNVAYPYLNTIGGNYAGRYVPQQMPFVGVGHMEIIDNSAFIAKLTLRQRIGVNHYVSLIGNYGLYHNDLFSLFKGKSIGSGAVGYAYNTLFGPLEATLGFSSVTKKLKFYASIGYTF